MPRRKGKNSEITPKQLRVTVVGDGDTGKTSILIAYKDKTFSDKYVPTIFDSYSMDIPIGNSMYHVILSDTAGQEDFDKLRRLAYADTDIFILCYAVDSRDSFDNIRQKWIQELRVLQPRSKIILTGTKRDLRKSNPNCITTQQGQELAKKVKADGFLESSAKLMINVEQTFETAFMSALHIRRRQKQLQCLIS